MTNRQLRARRWGPAGVLALLLAGCAFFNPPTPTPAPFPTLPPGASPIVATVPPWETDTPPPAGATRQPAPTQPPAATRQPSPTRQTRATPSGDFAFIETVVDGDTVYLRDGRKVRLLGVNTPERGQPFYDEAKQFLTDAGLGQAVRIETDVQSHDRYGRLLAYLYLPDGTFLNIEIVRRGYAQAWTISPNSRYEADFTNAEREARDKRRGLWATSSIPLEIVGIEPDPEGPDEERLNDETVTIKNVGTSTVRLGGFRLSDRSNLTYIFPEISLRGGASITLHSGRGRDSARDLYWGSTNPIWNNSGDGAYLRDTEGNLIDVYEYP